MTDGSPVCVRGGGWTALCAAALVLYEYETEVRLRLRPLDPDVLPRPLPPAGQPAWASLIARWLPEETWSQFGGFPIDPLQRRTIVDANCRRQLRAVPGGWEVTDSDRIWAWSRPRRGFGELWNRAIDALARSGVDVEVVSGGLDPVDVRAAARSGERQFVILSPPGRWAQGGRRRARYVPPAATGAVRWWLAQPEDTVCLPDMTDDAPLEVDTQLAAPRWRPWGLLPERGVHIWIPPGPLDVAPAQWFTEIRRHVRQLCAGRTGDWQRNGDCV